MLESKHSYLLNDNNSGIQWKLLSCVILMVFSLITGFLSLRGNIFNAAPYYVYFGTVGPFSASINPNKDGTYVIDEKKTQFKAGEVIGWTSDITIEPGVKVKASTVLHNKTLNQDFFVQESTINVMERRTGSKDFFFKLPIGIPPGYYEIQRKAVFFPNGNMPVGENYPSIPFEVIAP